MNRVHYVKLRDMAEAPNNPTSRQVAYELICKTDAAGWEEGPHDYDLREFILQAAHKTHEAEKGDQRNLWARVLSGLLEAAIREPEHVPTFRKLKTPDETWTKPRLDQGGD